MTNWTIDMAATGRKIKSLMDARHMKATEVSSFMGFQEPRAVYKWLSGTTLPSVDNLMRLSKLLDTPMDEILQVHEYQDELCGSSCCCLEGKYVTLW